MRRSRYRYNVRIRIIVHFEGSGTTPTRIAHGDKSGESRQTPKRTRILWKERVYAKKEKHKPCTKMSSPHPTDATDKGDYPTDIEDESLTVLVSHHVRHDKHEAFKLWSQETNALVRNFEGFLNAEVIRPATAVTAACAKTIGHANSSVPEGHDEFIVIVRFDNFAHLNAWATSPERQTMNHRMSEFADEAPTVTFHSLEHWFVTDDDVEAAHKGAVGTRPPPIRPPKKWKMVIVTVTIIYTQSLWIPKVTRRVLDKPLQEDKIHPYLFQFVNVVLIVNMATFVFFPVLTRLLSFWLLPGIDYRAKLLELVPNRFKQPKSSSKPATTVSEKADV